MTENLKDEVARLHAQLCSCLADPNRILILYSLADAPKNVNELSRTIGLPQPTVSRHLKMLREHGLLVNERIGQMVVYRVRDGRIIEALDLLREMMADILQESAVLARQSTESLVI